MIERCRIVLVRPEVAGNVGATARVMANFGLVDLVLVQPKADLVSHEARQRAANAEGMLEKARIVDSIDEALSDCLASAATSARREGIIRGSDVGPPEQILRHMLPLTSQGPIALVFGPEPSGLTSLEVSRCDHLISIPTSAEYPVLNLSHAVAICVYEFCRQTPGVQPATNEPPAPDDVREAMLQHLRSGLKDIHFLWDEKADQLFHGLRRLISRAQPTTNEAMLLRGIARQMQWVVKNNYKAPSADKNAGQSID